MPRSCLSSLPRLLPLLAMLIGSAPLRAQTPAHAWISIAPGQCVWHAGDNSAWAAPAFDDSAWQPYSTWKIDAHTPRLWVRCHANLTPLRTVDQPALAVSLRAASQVFVDGALAGSSGNLSSAQFNIGGFYTAPIAPGSLAATATLALRIVLRDLQNQGTPAEILLGDRTALEDHHAAAALRGSVAFLPIAACFALIGVVGFMLLGLYVTDRRRLELLLLAIVCWLLCDLRLCEFCVYAHAPISSALYNFLYSWGEWVEVVWLWFIFRIAGKRIPRLYWLPLAVTLSWFFNILAAAFLPERANIAQDAFYLSVNLYVFLAGIICTTAPLVAFWPWNRIPRNLRAIAFFCAAWGGADCLRFVLYSANIFGFIRDNRIEDVQNYLLILRASTTLCAVLALLTILFREQRRIAEDRALLAGEMQAAREIQSLLAPAVLETIPGFQVDVAFHPMREVGGDFYLCRALPGERQRILVGDVSGKGTAAAMTATLLIGAAERRDSDSPAALLQHLNSVLRTSRVGGFATCLCADVASDGSVSLANAGHLPPYCRGQEIPVVSALPLGVNAPGEPAYEETRFTLQPGDTLTFLSDGVVEAQNASGELFGFDRAQRISCESAESIAHAASAYGQRDDITVLTLAFAPAEVLHA